MNAYLKSLLVFILFILYNEGGKLLIEYFILNGYVSLNHDYIYIVDIIINLPLLVILFLFIRKTDPNLFHRNRKDNSNPYLLIYVVLLSLSFKIATMPIMHLDFMLGERKIGTPLPLFSKVFILLSFFSMVILIPFVEEIIFRKIILSFFEEKQIIKGIIFSSFLFLAAHYGYKKHINIQIINILFLGFITGALYIKYGFLYNYIFHVVYNLLWYIFNFNRKEYSELLLYLNFNYKYWIIIFLSLVGLVYLINKLRLSPLSLKRNHST